MTDVNKYLQQPMLGLEQILELIRIQKKSYERMPDTQFSRDLVFSYHRLLARNHGTFTLNDISALLPSTPNPTASNNHLEITISWTLPTSPRPITQYIISVNGVENQRVNAPTREATFTAPNAGTYRIGVAAVNSLGTSEYGYVNVEATNPPEPPAPVAPAFTTTSFSVADAFSATRLGQGIFIADNHFYIVGNQQNYFAVYTPAGVRVLDDSDGSNNPLQYRPTQPTNFLRYENGGVGQDTNIYVGGRVDRGRGRTDTVIIKQNTMGRYLGAVIPSGFLNIPITGIVLVDDTFYLTKYGSRNYLAFRNTDTLFTTAPKPVNTSFAGLDRRNENSTGITFVNNKFFTADRIDKKLYCYNADWTRSAVNDITLTYTRNPNPTGLTSHNGYIYVLDNNGMVYPIQV